MMQKFIFTASKSFVRVGELLFFFKVFYWEKNGILEFTSFVNPVDFYNLCIGTGTENLNQTGLISSSALKRKDFPL